MAMERRTALFVCAVATGVVPGCGTASLSPGDAGSVTDGAGAVPDGPSIVDGSSIIDGSSIVDASSAVDAGQADAVADTQSGAGGWPNSSNTGYKNAPGYPGSLTDCSSTVIQSGQTYKFCDFGSGVRIGSSSNPVTNVTIFGSRFHGSGDSTPLALVYGDNITFDYDSLEPEVSAPPVSHAQGYEYGIEANGGWYTAVQQMTVTHCDIWGFADAIDTTGSTQTKPQVFRDNWVHDARADGGSDHTDGIGQLNGTNAGSYVVLDHNAIVSSGNTQGIAFQTTTCDHFTITNNYLSGWGYTVDICTHASGNTNVLFSGNTFGTDIAPAWGPLYGWSDGTNNVWKCNHVHFVSGTTWTDGNGWTPGASDDGKFWTPDGVSATDYKGNTSCP